MKFDKQNIGTICINGIFTRKIDIADRGFQFGDGIFETMAFSEDNLEFWSEHMSRLKKGCKVLSMPCPDLKKIFFKAKKMCKSFNAQGALKLIVSRGIGERGYKIPEKIKPSWAISLYPWPKFPEANFIQGVNVRKCITTISRQPLLSRIKHLNRLEQVLARSEWKARNITEGLMCDDKDHVIEGTMSNIFLVKNNNLYTPNLDFCGIDGIMRNIVIKIAKSKNIKISIQKIKYNELFKADGLFLVNSLIGIWPIRRLDNKIYQPIDLTKEIANRLEKITVINRIS